MLKGVLKAASRTDVRNAPTYAKFGGGLEAVRTPGAPTTGDLRRVFAAETLDRLTSGDAPGGKGSPAPDY